MKHPMPYVNLIVDGTRLPPSIMDWLEQITLEQTCDGADVLRLTFNAWDEMRAQYRFLAERGIRAGAKVVLECGYGRPGFGPANPLTKGRFELAFRKPVYEPDGVKVTFEGYDDLRRMTDNKQSRVWLDGASDSDIIRMLARDEYGWAVDTVPNPPSPPRNAAIQAPSRESREAIRATGFDKRDRLKPLGLSDLAFAKILAEANGFMYPKLRWDAERNVEVFVFRPPCTEANDWSQVFRYRSKGIGESDFSRFTPEFSTTDAPTGVEFLGWDRKAGKPIRVVATVTQHGPEIACDDGMRLDERIEGDIRSGASLRLSVLGSGTRNVALNRVVKKTSAGTRAWNPLEEVRESVSSLLIPTPGDVSVETLSAMAKQWLLDRQAAWWTMTATFENLQDSHLLDSDQVHSFVGLDPLDEGWYILLGATHTWIPKERSHTVDVTGQKLIDGDALAVSVRTEDV